MRMIETETGIVLESCRPGSDCRVRLRALLDLLRRDRLTFLIGGPRESDVLTIGPLSRSQQVALCDWWARLQEDAGPEDQ